MAYNILNTYLINKKREAGESQYIAIQAHVTKVRKLQCVTSGKYEIIPVTLKLRYDTKLGIIPTYLIVNNQKIEPLNGFR